MHWYIIRSLIFAVVTGSSVTLLHAHDDSKPLAPQHGGQLVEDANHHSVELVLDGTSIAFHLREHAEPLDLAGSNFKAIVQTDAGTRTLDLAIDGSALRGSLDAPLPKGSRVVLTGKDGHGDAIQARFVTE